MTRRGTEGGGGGEQGSFSVEGRNEGMRTAEGGGRRGVGANLKEDGLNLIKHILIFYKNYAFVKREGGLILK